MAAYTWELGIDWNANPIDAFSFHLSQGLVDSVGNIATPWLIRENDIIQFKVFDVTSGGPAVTAVESFIISLGGTTTNPFDLLEPSFNQGPDSTTAQSVIFKNVADHSPGFASQSWTQQPLEAHVTVQDVAPLRVLLRFQVQARMGDESRAFGHDPEMVVGAGG